MTIYGIDLGTTYSCIARVDSSGRPEIIRNRLGREVTPSVVYFESPFHVVVGDDAKKAALTHPDLVVSRIKREMGHPEAELDFHDRSFTPEGISAFVLGDLVGSVREATGEEVKDVVITVPAYFGVAERESTKAAGAIAGLNVVNVVAEPVAAAFFYGVHDTDATRTVLVFDLGGGTFDTTVIRLGPGEVTVVCTDGDHQLGGADWDDRLAAHLCDLFTEQFPGTGAEDDEKFLQDIALHAEELKQSLTSRQACRHRMTFGDHTAVVEVRRDTFEAITAEFVERTMAITERTLGLAAERGVDHYDEVLLVGGSTRMPAIDTALRERFGFAPKLHEPDLAVAKGAAWFALHESVRLRRPVGDDSPAAEIARAMELPEGVVRATAERAVTNVVPRAFGVAVVDPADPDGDSFLVNHLISANTALPVQKRKQFVTAYDDQTSIQVLIYEQAGSIESEEAEHNKHIGEAVVSRLPPLRKGSPVDVTFKLDADGVLNVDVLEIKTRGTATVDIKIGDLTERQVARARDDVARLT
ncbi:Hsp70 family protein [Amycolatopsis sp. NPDC101161]|uniref:Hsp70 family protein n=1 Tax=Amycolatopsis sp. NPDC101161 TaxID=3363940 RepID=UPI00380C4FE1